VSSTTSWLRTDSNGVARCWWPGDDPLYVAYHDHEWGIPVGTDNGVFEKMCLEGFQAGLAWITILRKREHFRAAFAGFDIATVAGFDDADVTRLVSDAGIVRHRAKIESAINNARQARVLLEREGDGALAALFWSFEPDGPTRDSGAEMPIPAVTDASTRLSKELKRRGFSFVGPTTMYAHMQATGMVNDHLDGCHAQARVEAARAAFTRPRPRPAAGG
jgi:DNA-3-methyladenine glycosylase I